MSGLRYSETIAEEDAIDGGRGHNACNPCIATCSKMQKWKVMMREGGRVSPWCRNWWSFCYLQWRNLAFWLGALQLHICSPSWSSNELWPLRAIASLHVSQVMTICGSTLLRHLLSFHGIWHYKFHHQGLLRMPLSPFRLDGERSAV